MFINHRKVVLATIFLWKKRKLDFQQVDKQLTIINGIVTTFDSPEDHQKKKKQQLVIK